MGQIGLKEGYLAAVKNISSVIGVFVQHAEEEGNVYLEEFSVMCTIRSFANVNKAHTNGDTFAKTLHCPGAASPGALCSGHHRIKKI